MGNEPVTEAQCKHRSDVVLAAIRALECRLYKDNGQLSIQTRLDRHENSVQLLSRIVYGAVGLTLVTVAGSILALVLRS